MRFSLRARRVLATAIALAAAASFAPAAAGQADGYAYAIERRGNVRSDVERFAEIAAATLSDFRGWATFRHRRAGSRADVRLVLATPAEVEAAAPVCSRHWSCAAGDRVLINDRRWRRSTPSWPLSRRAYRSYVLNHEIGHWLGLGHASCPGRGRKAPVMMQQSKGLDGCAARVWPKRGERKRVAALHAPLDRAPPAERRPSPTGLQHGGRWADRLHMLARSRRS